MWMDLSLKVMDIGNVYGLRSVEYHNWLGSNPLVLTTILGSEKLRKTILVQCTKVTGMIYMLLHTWKGSVYAGRGA
jgi:pyruvate-formate lyase